MPPASPRHRYEAVVAAVRSPTAVPPTDETELMLYNILKKIGTPNSFVAYANDLYTAYDQRAVLDAFLLAGAEIPTMARVLGIPEVVLHAYEFLFFDSAVFRNRLEKISYVSDYKGDAYASELLKTGVMVGASYLIWTYGGRETVETREIVRHTMIDAYFRGMSHKGNTLTSGVAKEAQKWWATAIKNAEILEKMDPQATKQAYEEIKIALEGVDETLPVEKAPVPLEDILH